MKLGLEWAYLALFMVKLHLNALLLKSFHSPDPGLCMAQVCYPSYGSQDPLFGPIVPEHARSVSFGVHYIAFSAKLAKLSGLATFLALSKSGLTFPYASDPLLTIKM